MFAPTVPTYKGASALSGIGFSGKSEQLSLDSQTARVPNEAFFQQFLAGADPETLGNYFVWLISAPQQETSILRKHRPTQISPQSTITPIYLEAEVLPDIQIDLAYQGEKYVSFAQALLHQSTIHQRLKQEIEDGLEAETRYWKYFNDENSDV